MLSSLNSDTTNTSISFDGYFYKRKDSRHSWKFGERVVVANEIHA